MEANFAKKGVATAGLTTGIIGTALGALNGIGGIGGLFGTAPATACSESCLVNRYELGLEKSIAEKDSKIALLEANTYNDQKSLELYKYIDGELREVRGEIARQAVLNQKTEDAFLMVRNDMICCKNELYSAINRERDERCCADNAIVNYSNATFYPKMVADVTTGTTTTAQALYNPLPQCGNRCC